MAQVCPSDETQLKLIRILNTKGQQATAKMCGSCGGVFLDASAQIVLFNNVLKADPSALHPGERGCPCEKKGTLERMILGDIALDICSACEGIWFDAGKLVVIAERIRAQTKAPTPPQDLSISCVDCRERRVEAGALLDVGSGLLCATCQQRPSSPSGKSFQYRSGKVTVQHSGESEGYEGSVSIGFSFKSTLEGRLGTPGLWRRVLSLFGRSGVSLGRSSLDEGLWIESKASKTLKAFFTTHGVPELLLELLGSGEGCEVSFEASSMKVSVKNWRSSPLNAPFPPRTHFESIARRLYDRLVYFLSQEDPTLSIDSVDEWSPIDA